MSIKPGQHMGGPCKRGHDGLRYDRNHGCVRCAQEESARQRAVNPRGVAAAKRKARLAKPEYYKAMNASWRGRNPEKVIAYRLKWAANNPELVLACSRAYYANNAAAHAERMKQWASKNPTAARAVAANRRARMRKIEGRYSHLDVEQLYIAQNGRCAYFLYCATHLGDTFHVDHIMPVARGGSNWPVNLQLTCPTCNLRKSDADPADFLARLQCARLAA